MVIHLCTPNAFVQLLWVFLIALSFIFQIHFLWHLQKPLKLLGKHYTHNMSAGSQRWGTSFAVYRLYYDDITYIMPEWCLQARYKLQLDPTLEEVKKLCNTCRKFARTERVLFHYNGHGVPKPTANGEIWVFNKVNVAKTLHKLLHCLSMCVFDEVPFFYFLCRVTHNIFRFPLLILIHGWKHLLYMFLTAQQLEWLWKLFWRYGIVPSNFYTYTRYLKLKVIMMISYLFLLLDCLIYSLWLLMFTLAPRLEF